MKKSDSLEIPKSDLTNSVMIVIDSNSKENDIETLFINQNTIVIGCNGIPITLFISPEFRVSTLPTQLKKNIHEVTLVSFQGDFTGDTVEEIDNLIIPTEHLVSFKKLESLKLRYAELDNLIDLKDLPIKELTLQNIKFSNRGKLISALEQFNNLKEVFYDQSLPIDIINSLNNSNLKFTRITNHFTGR